LKITTLTAAKNDILCNEKQSHKGMKLARITIIPLPTGLHTHTHPFNGSLSGTTRVNQHQKGKTNLDFTEARESEWQCHQLGHMQVCTSFQTDNHTSTPPLSGDLVVLS